MGGELWAEMCIYICDTSAEQSSRTPMPSMWKLQLRLAESFALNQHS